MNVNYAPQIIDSFKASIVERILVIDDAYDAPELAEVQAGDLADVLGSSELRKHISEELLSEDDREAAMEALVESELGDEAVHNAVLSLYSAFVETRSPEVDPHGEFAALKGAALEALDPLVELLERCADAVHIRRVGKDGALRAYRALKPDLILMDFYLSPPERTARAATKGESDADRERSISLLKDILRDDESATPAVVLMSSEEVGGLTQAYRRRLKGRVTALRFGFLNKNWIDGSGPGLSACGDAADVFMDTSGSLAFGRTLEAALRRWKAGAKAGLEKLYDDLSDFDVTDFAYLLRFRLYQEGEPFADYLEWFFGESLRAIVDDEVEWNAEVFSQIDERDLTESIEGAHPFPSDRIARFFHRMRFNSRANRERKRYALGDLFVASNSRDVRLVITPDCDLVPRKKGPGASRVLTVGGKIWGLDADQAFAGEFLFYNSPKSIKWNYKDLMTHEFDDISTLCVGETVYAYFGTLRSMSAQTVQKAALADLSRVGLAVPPAVDVGAPVKAFVKKDIGGQARMVELLGFGDARAQVVLPRGGNDGRKRAVFTRKFVRELMAKVDELKEEELLEDHKSLRSSWLGDSERVRKAMLREGVELPGEGLFRVGMCVGSEKGRSWLEIVVDVSDEALIRLPGIDPLAD